MKVYDYEELMKLNPLNLGIHTNTKQQLIQFYECPIHGGDCYIICVSHELRKAEDSTFFEIDDMIADHAEYEPWFDENGKLQIGKLKLEIMKEEKKEEKFNIIEAIREWSINFNLPVLDTNEFPSREEILKAYALIEEEKEELWDAIQNKDFTEAQDALGDLLWVVVRNMMVFGIDPYKTIEAIYKSNMSKLDNTLEDALTTKNEYLKKGIETYYQQNSEGKYITFRKSDDKVQKSYRFQQPNFNI